MSMTRVVGWGPFRWRMERETRLTIERAVRHAAEQVAPAPGPPPVTGPQDVPAASPESREKVAELRATLPSRGTQGSLNFRTYSDESVVVNQSDNVTDAERADRADRHFKVSSDRLIHMLNIRWRDESFNNYKNEQVSASIYHLRSMTMKSDVVRFEENVAGLSVRLRYVASFYPLIKPLSDIVLDAAARRLAVYQGLGAYLMPAAQGTAKQELDLTGEAARPERTERTDIESP